MAFYDRKEEVLSFELTQYGKYLLSKGRFKPAYYQFFDDDIVYDGKYAGILETQSEIQTRIKETSRMHLQYTFSSAETQMKKNIELVRSGKEKNLFSNRFLPTAEKHYSLCAPLGTSDIANNKIPAWNINFLRGSILSSQNITTGSHQTLTIPRLTLDALTYITYPKKEDDNISLSNNPSHLDTKDIESLSELNVVSKKFDDNTFIKIEDDYILIDIKEENVPISNKNFDIEVYLIENDLNDDRRNKETLIPLFFPKKKQQVENGILVLDEEENNTVAEFEPFFVNHFFNVFVDKEIDPDVLCTVLTEEEIIALTSSGEYDFECAKQVRNNTFVSDVSPEDIEEC